MLEELFEPAKIDSAYKQAGTYSQIKLEHYRIGESVLQSIDIGLIGVEEDTNALHKGAALAPDRIRKAFYSLTLNHENAVTVRDFGNIKKQETVQDTYKALSFAIGELLQYQIIPVIIGGSQDLTYPLLLGYPKAKNGLNLLSIDYTFNWDNEKDFNDQSYLNQILFDDSIKVNHYANLGDQIYFIPAWKQEIAEKNNWFNIRLGSLRKNITDAEPFIRHADFITFDWGVMKNAFLNDMQMHSPNGLEPHEACHLAKYAGISDRNKGLGLFNYIPDDSQDFGALLLAQMIWYYIDGFAHRTGDFPDTDIEETTKFIISFRDFDHSIVFFQSKRSGRWWMEVPAHKNKTEIVPCSYNDYKLASKQEIPDLWYKYFHKFGKKK